MLGVHQSSVATSLERLATGKRINRASDDPSGLIAAEQFKFRMTTLEKRIERFEFEETRLGATEGGLSVVSEMVIDLQGLAVTFANSGAMSDEEREALKIEAQSIIEGIGTLETTTIFNGDQVLAGLGPDLSEFIEALDANPEKAQEIVDQAVDEVAGRRGAIGNRLIEIDAERGALYAEFEGNAEALSSIQDTDFAKESASLIRAQILEQATIKAMLVEREQADRVLDLIASVPTIQPLNN
ncbi:MAG: flagellin [Phycisphaerales bacterium]